MEKAFKINVTCHDQYGIQIWFFNENSKEEFESKKEFLRMAVLNNWVESEFYQKKQKANPFLQSYCDDFVMVEFWTHDLEAIEEYVDFLNQKYSEGK